MDQKEALLHYIVHDLKGPLSGMVGTMSLLQKADLAEERRRELLDLGLEGARHQEAMITSILYDYTKESDQALSVQAYLNATFYFPTTHSTTALTHTQKRR